MTSEPDWVAVGARIKKMCDEKGFSRRREFQKALGLSSDGVPIPLETISHWWHGRQPSSANLARIAQALEVTEASLLWGERGPPKSSEKDTAIQRARELLEREGWAVEPPAADEVPARRVNRKASGVDEIAEPARRARRR